MSMVKHAQNPAAGAEFTVCGLAFDAYNSADADAPVLFAKPGEVVTCSECRKAVKEIRQIKLGHLRDRKEDAAHG